jgi:hypothetical protein
MDASSFHRCFLNDLVQSWGLCKIAGGTNADLAYSGTTANEDPACTVGRISSLEGIHRSRRIDGYLRNLWIVNAPWERAALSRLTELFLLHEYQ